jgi:hypothetical protein
VPKKQIPRTAAAQSGQSREGANCPQCRTLVGTHLCAPPSYFSNRYPKPASAQPDRGRARPDLSLIRTAGGSVARTPLWHVQKSGVYSRRCRDSRQPTTTMRLNISRYLKGASADHNPASLDGSSPAMDSDFGCPAWVLVLLRSLGLFLARTAPRDISIRSPLRMNLIT